MSKKNWYFTRLHYYANLSNLFAGFGALVLEGDALLHYFLKNGHSEINSKAKLNNFIKKNLKESGFDKIYIVFFHNHSKWTESDEDSKLTLKQQSLQLTSDLAGFVRIFHSWTCKEWSNFVDVEHMSVFLATDSEIYQKKNSQFDLIEFLCNTNNLQIALIDGLKFANLKVNCFLIVSNREYHSLNSKDSSLNKDDEASDLNDAPTWYQSDISVLENDQLNSLLDVNNNQSVILDPNLISNSVSPILWEIKLNYKKSFRPEKADENKKKQFYSRHMERYAESLDSSKYLHYKIITNIDSKNQVKPEKMSTKAKEIIEANDAQSLKKKEEKELNFLKSLKIKCYNDIDESFKLVDTSKYSQLAQYTILHLRIKWLQNEPKVYENRKQNLFLFIKEAIEIFEDQLTLIDAENMLKCLKSLEFHSSCEYLKQQLIKNRKDFKPLKKIETSADSFDHDVLFQLRYCGDKLKRTLNSKKDERVRFEPDKWQRDLLDAVDRKESALICCPTSSGKTFISYYVMEKALRNSHDDIVVFIAPMKALANQAAAEIYARFGSKTYPKGFEKSIYAMNMPDFTINDPYNCQILITMPPTFESMLCENKPEWISKVKYIIIDEIQTINDQELGSSIEKIIHMALCPMLFISATIGNLEPFYNWLNSIQIAKGIKLNRIVHNERFCDLKKYLYSPVDEDKIIPMHELFGYSEKHLKNNEIAEEFHLLPSEITEILSALEEICSNEEQKSLIAAIQPNKFFKNVILNKRDVKNYETFVMKNLIEWCQSEQFSSEQINKFFDIINEKCAQAFKKIHKIYGSKITTRQWSHDHIFELVESMYKKKMLPAIVFLNSCDECDKLTEKLVNRLKLLENEERDSKEVKRTEKTKARLEKLKKNLRERKNSGELDRDEYEMFEELALSAPIVNDKYTFLDSKYKLTDQEIDEEINMHKNRKIPSFLFDGWKRGIGVHHSLHHTKFRSSVECLFRKRHLQIVFATETLSLGVNMPCKTVVMPSECIYINSIYYRHMIGRAGRRGFDTIGNIVFYGVPERRVKNMISSKTANIRGTHSFDLNLVMQVSAMQNYYSHAYIFFKSYMDNSILSLSSSDFESEKCKKYAHVKIQYLLNKNYINSKFNPMLKSHPLFLLRNENIDIYLIIDFILSESFDLILTSDTSDIEEIAKRICLFLCHFCHVRYVSPSHAKSFKSSNLKILLPVISELESFIKNEKRNFKMFLNSFSLSESEIEINQNGFSDYHSVLLPKNSYLYDFYLEGKLDRIKEVNSISEATLWYALRDLRYLSTALKSLFSKFKGDLINMAFNYYSEKISERFFQVCN